MPTAAVRVKVGVRARARVRARFRARVNPNPNPNHAHRRERLEQRGLHTLPRWLLQIPPLRRWVRGHCSAAAAAATAAATAAAATAAGSAPRVPFAAACPFRLALSGRARRGRASRAG